jgi:DNA-3-methyladenine glycosylase
MRAERRGDPVQGRHEMTKLGRQFYARPAIEVARDLLGKVLVRRIGRKQLRARIVETEAYVGEHDLACHASKGRTKRTEVMFGPGGYAYVYLIYGMYDMFNIVASIPADAQAVLIRAAEPLDAWAADLSGPGKLAREMKITRALNGTDLTGDGLFLLDDVSYRARVKRSKRIGVEYAGGWKNALLRFVDIRSKLGGRLNAKISVTPRARASGMRRSVSS